MIDYKQVLEELIEHSKHEYEKIGTPIRLFNGFKPSQYFLPSIQIGSYPPRNEPAYCVEIFIGDKLILRDGLSPNEESDEIFSQKVNLLFKRILITIFLSGIFHIELSLKDIIEKNNHAVRKT